MIATFVSATSSACLPRRRAIDLQALQHLVQQVADALAVLGGDRYDRIESEPVELDMT